MKEQFIDSCPKDLAIHLRERAPETLAKIAKIQAGKITFKKRVL